MWQQRPLVRTYTGTSKKNGRPQNHGAPKLSFSDKKSNKPETHCCSRRQSQAKGDGCRGETQQSSSAAERAAAEQQQQSNSRAITAETIVARTQPAAELAPPILAAGAGYLPVPSGVRRAMLAVAAALLLLGSATNALQTRGNVRMSFDLDRAVDTLTRNRILTKVASPSSSSARIDTLAYADFTAGSSF